jgi:hypothetical protein
MTNLRVSQTSAVMTMGIPNVFYDKMRRNE